MKRFTPIIFSCLTNLLACTSLMASSFGERVENYVNEIPGIGLISDFVEFDGITLRNFRFDNDKKYIFVEPEQEFSAQMEYDLDAGVLKALHLHHLIIGLHNDGPQQCILHSLGVFDSHGGLSATLKAPKKRGAYQVRFCHTESLSDDDAKQAWWREDGPSAKTIMGIVIVR